MNRFLLPTLFAATAVYATAADPMADACERLLVSLENEVEILEDIEQPQDADAAVEKLRAVLQLQQELMAVDAGELWQYIDNTAGVKQPLVDALSSLALQFIRLENAAYYNHAGLKELLAPQTEQDPAAQKAKLEKIRAVDHDED